MKKDVAHRTNRNEYTPHVRRSSSFLTPWFDDIFEPRGWLGDVFNRDLAPYENLFLSPAVDIDETSEEYVVSADLPGVKKENISIECIGNQLTISAERKSEPVEGARNDRKERYYGSYMRSFTLPTGADADKVEATYEGGVLTVKIPKGEAAKSRKISIGESKALGSKKH